MPFTIRCHSCNQSFPCPDAAAGRRVKCPKCGQKLTVPIPTLPAGATDWMTAPPPMRHNTPSADGPPLDAAAPPPQQSEPTPATDYDYDDEPEPWYYHFIERYVSAGLWVGTVLIALSFVGFTVLCWVMGAALTTSKDVPVAGALGGGCFVIVYWMYLALIHVAAVFFLFYICSWLLVALDAARNLRRIRLKFRGR